LAKYGLTITQPVTRWLLVALPLAVRGDFAHHFVAPEHYFDMPKLAAFRAWLEDCVQAFPPPETEATG